MKTNCSFCNKELDRRPSIINKGNCYCDASCQLKYEYKEGTRKKENIALKANIARRKQGQERFLRDPRKYVSKRGYKIIYVPGRGDVKHHHYLWEKQFGKIPKGYHLHHINLYKLDNRIENLQLIPSKEHAKLHDRLRKRNTHGQFIKKL